MYRWIMSTIVVVACVMGVYLLAAGLPQRPHEEVLPAGQEALKITATSFNFDKPEYHVKAGKTYQIKFANKLGKHGAEIADLNINLDESHPTATYTFDKPGRYEMHCSIMCGQGHGQMVSTIVVE